MVRLLPKINGGVRPLFPFPDNIISYEDVTLHHMSHGSGRVTTNEILADPRRTAGFAKEIAEVILREIPEDEAINIFTFKDRGRIKYGERLATALERHGVEMTEKLADGRPRINIVPWGRETATNEYAYAKHTIFAGVLHRDPLDLIAATVAANRNLLADENLDLVKKIMTSEVAHSLGQAAGRSAIRYANYGKAAPGSIWLPIKTPGVVELLTSVVFPGIKVVPWLPTKTEWTSGESGSRKVAAERSSRCWTRQSSAPRGPAPR